MEEVKDILITEKPDRRLLSHVPDKSGRRSNFDRRGSSVSDAQLSAVENHVAGYLEGMRYLVDYSVKVVLPKRFSKSSFMCTAQDISSSGILLSLTEEQAELLKKVEKNKVKLKFEIIPGSMPEGYEMKVNIKANVVRFLNTSADGKILCGLQFDETLAQYATRTKHRYTLAGASFFMFVIVFLIVMMRTESVIYFKFNESLYLYSIAAASFLLTRYLFATFYKTVPIDKDFTPGVTIIIPCFNEETWIRKTILSCVNQDYPIDKLEIIVIDDHSTDNSVQVIKDTLKELEDYESGYETKDRVSYFVQPQNAGKREAMAVGAKLAKHDLLVFVDSDSFLDPFAVINIVQPFKDKDMGGVSGRTDVANTYTNGLTKMQAVRYYISFRVMKAAEAYFDAVTCLSGPLSCYRKDLVMKNMDAWLNQTFLGQRATFGDDRSMTNFILRTNRTGYQDTAICATIVPNNYSIFIKQQMRWKRSWLRESINAGRFMWKKEPFMALFFYMGVLVPIFAPLIVLYNLVYVPFHYRVFPWTFLMGMFLMAMMMSVAQKILRQSSTWLYGLWFCLYYEAVLLWQMPIAWVTFWKANWGTRPTPADVKEDEEKKAQAYAKDKKIMDERQAAEDKKIAKQKLAKQKLKEEKVVK